MLDRYYLYSVRGETLLREQVSHERYKFRAADVSVCSAIPAQLHGFPELSDSPMHSCFVDGFDVNVYATQTVD